MNSTLEHAEAIFVFSVPVDRAAYFLPTAGIVAIGSVAAAMVLMAALMTLPGVSLLQRLIPSALRDIALFGAIAGAGVLAGMLWVRCMMRIHRERKLVIDRSGITYHAFANHQKAMRWDDIVRVVETSDRVEECLSLRVHLAAGHFDVGNDDFVGYDLIKFIVLNRLPGITATLVRVHDGVDTHAVAKALRQWGHAKGASSLLFMSH